MRQGRKNGKSPVETRIRAEVAAILPDKSLVVNKL
jgi:hypothetical protein